MTCPHCDTNLKKRICNDNTMNNGRNFYYCNNCNYIKWEQNTVNNYPPIYPQSADEVNEMLNACSKNKI